MIRFQLNYRRRTYSRFDPALHERLRDQWEREGVTDPALWALAQPYTATGGTRCHASVTARC